MECDPDRVRAAVARQLDGVTGWQSFQERRVVLRVEDHIDWPTRDRLGGLPTTIRLFGDATAIEYDIVRGEGIARLRLREGQARRLTLDDLPPFDRPVWFSVTRGDEAPIESDSLETLGARLRKPAPRAHPHGKSQPPGRNHRRGGPRPPKRRR